MGFRSRMELCKVGNMFGIDVLICLLHKRYVHLVAFSPFVNAAFNLEVQYDQFISVKTGSQPIFPQGSGGRGSV